MDKQKTYSEIINAVASEVKKAINEAYGPDLTPEQEFYVECIERRNNGETWSSLAREFNKKFNRNISPDVMRGRVGDAAIRHYSSKPNIDLSQREAVNSVEGPTVETNKPTDNKVVGIGRVNMDDVVDLGLPSGTLWMKHNLGAKCKDTPKSWYGDYYAWGEITPKEQYDLKNYKHNGRHGISKYCMTSDNKKVLDLEDDAIHVNIGGNWHMPTLAQTIELGKNTDSEWVEDYNGISGLNGRLFTSRSNGKSIFFPAAGWWDGNRLHDDSYDCFLWSSSCNWAQQYMAFTINPGSDSVVLGVNFIRHCGLSVRGVL